MTSRRATSTLLLTLTAVALPLAIAACSGGGGGNAGDPCCGATGQTEQPSQSPFAASGSLFAQPVVLNTAQCFTLDGGAPDFSAGILEIAGAPVQVQASGKYDVLIDKGHEGQLVSIRIFGGGDTPDRGLGAIPLPVQTLATTSAFHVAPIRFDDVSGRAGESTIEVMAYCAFRTQGLLQKISFADIRASISKEVAAGFFDGGPGAGSAAMLARIPHYRHAINSLIDVADAAGVANFPLIRQRAEALVDACKSGDGRFIDPSAIGCIPGAPNLDARAESYRFWFILKELEDVFPGPPKIFLQHVQAASQDLAESAGSLPAVGNPTDDAFILSLTRQAHLMRLEVAERSIRRTAACFQNPSPICDPATATISMTLATNGAPSLDASLTSLRAGLESGPTPALMTAAWVIFGTDVGANFSEQGGLDVFNAYTNMYANGRNQAITLQTDIDDDPLWTNEAIRARLYDQTNTGPIATQNNPGSRFLLLQQVIGQTETAYTTLSPLDKGLVADILFYTTVNTVQIPQ